jgi:hypothetical protein
MKKRSDFMGTELDWFAIDSDGFVAVMSSAGYGPIPDCVFERFDQQRRIEQFLTGLVGQQLMKDWDRMLLSLSASGVFVYDWEHWEGPYRRQGAPSVPERIDDLGVPAELRTGFAVVPERFSASVRLRPELLLTCTG